MTSGPGSIYEVTCFIDDEAIAAFDLWLEERVRESLRLAVIADCRIFPIANNENGRGGRVCQHVLETDEALDEFVDGAGADIESSITAAFGDAVNVSSRILREDAALAMPDGESPDCLNCGARLRGQYCGNCGQRSRSRLISLWELISDAFGDLFELDSRLWKTLLPLAIRPGRLTHEYLQGRRARYMPPFRMYLVMSLIFFVVAFFDPGGELRLVTETNTESAQSIGEVPADESTDASSELDRQREEIFEELARQGIIVSDGIVTLPGSDGEMQTFEAEGDAEAVVSEDEDDCNDIASDVEELPDWLAWLLTPERTRHICERVMADDGRALANELLDNIPAALIVLLPLIAMVLKVLYPLSRRYYVEHLLFFVHFHAFIFLILTIEILFARLAALTRITDSITAVTIVAVSFYIPVYLFVAMRHVYGQGRFVTFLKYIVLLGSYLAGLLVTVLGALAVAALSI